MAVPPSAPNPEAVATVDVAASSSLPGVLNHERYEARSLLGQGAFGAVYRSWDHQLHREVAIKIPKLRPRFQPDQFLREARSAARLRHPGLVTIFDAGYDRDGKPFAVFELIRGNSLLELAASGKLDVLSAVRLIAEAAEAMNYTHLEEIVHRDLKPSNILVDSDGRARVSDFGLALDDDALREHAGDVSGSPAYMSPEQVRGEAHRLDGRTDIWSLGAILYELLAGRRPFLGRERAEFFDEILHREPKPIRQINPSIPRALDDAVLKCLAKPVRERYSTAGDFAADLRTWLKQATAAGHGAERIAAPIVVTPSSPTVATIDPQVTTSREKARPAVASRPAVQKLPRSVVVVGTLFGVLLLGIAGAQINMMLQLGDESNKQRIDDGPPDRTAESTPDSSNSNALVAPFRVDLKPKKQGWQSLLLEKPTVFVAPAIVNGVSLLHNSLDHEVHVTSTGICMLEIGEINVEDYEFTIKFTQSPWIGGIGVYFGFHPERLVDSDLELGPATTCQALELVSTDVEPRSFALGRAVLTLGGKRILRGRETLQLETVAPQPGKANELKFLVREGKLTAIHFDGQELPALLSDELNKELDSRDITASGKVGIIVDTSSGVFRTAAWRSLLE